MRHALSHRKTSEFGEDMRHWNVILLARLFDISYNFIDHELVVVLKSQRVFYGKSTPDIDGIQFGADLFQLAIQVDHLVKLTPVIDIVFYALVQENMEHLELEPVFISFDLVNIEFQYVPGAEPEAGC